MRSVVVRNGGGVTFVVIEPGSPVDAGQITRFLDQHAGPGFQHVAIECHDVCAVVDQASTLGMDFVDAPPGYYGATAARLAHLDLPWDRLAALNVLADADEHGHLLQVFTHPLCQRGSFFLEFVQRVGSTGFGDNNVRALFHAVEGVVRGT